MIPSRDHHGPLKWGSDLSLVLERDGELESSGFERHNLLRMRLYAQIPTLA
jgi:hypothetical protein